MQLLGALAIIAWTALGTLTIMLLVGMTLLDLPRAVAHVMVRRVQAKMTPPAAAEGGVSWAVFEACYGGLSP